MGIQLTSFDRNMIKTAAAFRQDGIPLSPYFFGYLTARVDQFLQDKISREQLADDVALLELIKLLCVRCSTKELFEIAAGTRELPGEDVQSGQ